MMQSSRTLFFVLVVLVMAVSTITTVNAQQCTLCMDGQFPTKPDDKLKADEIQQGIETCGQLAGAIGFVEEDSDNCRSGRAVATTCGCNIPDGACKLCGGNARVPAEALDIQLNYTATDFIVGAPEGDMLSCEAMESYLHTQLETDAMCAEISDAVSEMCMCPDETTTTPTEPTDVDAGTGGGSVAVSVYQSGFLMMMMMASSIAGMMM